MNQNKQSKSKLNFAFVKLVVSVSNQNIEKQNILQKKIRKINKKESMCKCIYNCLTQSIKLENNDFSNIELCSKKNLIYFLKKL